MICSASRKWKYYTFNTTINSNSSITQRMPTLSRQWFLALKNVTCSWYCSRFHQPALTLRTSSWALMSSSTFFSKVFDGHGKEGHECALFCRKHLPEILEMKLHMLDTNGVDGQHLIEAAIHQSFLNCNCAMRNCSTVDDSLSGTTAVGVLLDGQDMYIANVSCSWKLEVRL